LPITISFSRKFRHLGLAFIILLMSTTAWSKVSLLEKYQRLKNGDSITLPDTRINLTSSVQDDLLSAEVNNILHTPFDTLATVLSQANNWCQILPLHFNIKACTHEEHNDAEILTLYSGRKIYQHPEDSYQMTYQFEVIQWDDSQLSLRLRADHGPLNTRDYIIELDALRIKEGTLLHIHSSYRSSMLSSILTSTYLSTLGSYKIGFSQIEQDGKSRPVQGIRGIIERNVMRYQLAINAFLNTRSLPETIRHEAMLASWFKQNDSFPQQLHEMDEAEYMKIKRRERQNQQQLQQALNDVQHPATTPQITMISELD